MIQNRETTTVQRGTYYCYFLGQNMLYFIVSSFAMLYFTDYMGVSAAAIGTIFLAARIWDAVNDPMFGIVVDKVNRKPGKYKFWINIASLVLPVITLLVFCVPDISATGKLVYITITYVLWGMTYTVSDVPGFGISTAISNNVDERNSMLANSRLFAVGGLLVISAVIMKLVSGIGWIGAAAVIAVAGGILMNLMRPVVHEKYQVADTGVTIRRIVDYVLHNKYLLIYYLGITLMFSCNTITVVSNYFAIYNLGSEDYIALMMIISIVPMLAAAVIAPPLIRRFGKYAVTMASCAVGVIIYGGFYMIGYGSIVMVVICMGIGGLAIGMTNVMYPMITADCIEYGTYVTGERATGISFSIQTFTTKLGQAVAASLGAFLLTASGYVPNVAQEAHTLKGIFSMITLLPALGMLGMMVIFGLFYKVREKDVELYINTNAQNYKE
ncbi:glycoside-pentoside-hexuronide (GPH):cation symporter [Lachnoclostridium pacaense]|uniref:MFS transporter n=1 Tax=Enterocloster hominis (ex Hitch et al. 2024) TaxID=1917870 RepID=UPI001D1187F7|nr:glycoside-pentoside-hexuronide (GPH):cation symporter [Lachnoclostridium pacaense]MCC2878062.1 glycoside-pentoside-hexuronide (GPH):cation symporter [Lachnoclostridium pacaense]